MYLLEREAQENPILADIIMGMERELQIGREANLTEIRERIDKRVGDRKAIRRMPFFRWAAAASALLVLGFGAFWISRDSTGVGIDLVQNPIVSEQEIAQADAALSDSVVLAEINEEPNTAQASASAPTVRSADKAATQLSERTTSSHPPTVITKTDSPSVLVAARTTKSVDPAVAAVSTISEESKKVLLDSANAIARVTPERQVSKADPKVLRAAVRSDQGISEALAGRVAGMSVEAGKTDEKTHVVSGVVRDRTTGDPMPGVQVGISSRGLFATTDSAGRFKLAVSSTDSALDVTYLGYASQQLMLDGADTLVIAMEPAEAQMDEVVISGYRVQVEDVAPSPSIGWRAYNKYLEENAKAVDGEKGAVTVNFHIGLDGRPTDILVTKGVTEALNQRAVELIREGVLWERGTRSNPSVRLRIKFK